MARSVFLASGLIEVTLPELSGVRDAKGRFTGATSAMRQRNAEFATGLQARVVRNIEARITRRGVSTGRLLKVTADPRNAEYDTWRAGVGVVRFLDGSVAKYWRTFEEGSAATWSRGSMVGLQLRGQFGSSIVGFKATRTPGPQPQPLAGGPWGGGGGKLRWYWSMPLNPNFTVKHDIAPRNAYRDAVQAAHPREFAIANARKLFADIIGRDLPGGFSMGGFTGLG